MALGCSWGSPGPPHSTSPTPPLHPAHHCPNLTQLCENHSHPCPRHKVTSMDPTLDFTLTAPSWRQQGPGCGQGHRFSRMWKELWISALLLQDLGKVTIFICKVRIRTGPPSQSCCLVSDNPTEAYFAILPSTLCIQVYNSLILSRFTPLCNPPVNQLRNTLITLMLFLFLLVYTCTSNSNSRYIVIRVILGSWYTSHLEHCHSHFLLASPYFSRSPSHLHRVYFLFPTFSSFFTLNYLYFGSLILEKSCAI